SPGTRSPPESRPEAMAARSSSAISRYTGGDSLSDVGTAVILSPGLRGAADRGGGSAGGRYWSSYPCSPRYSVRRRDSAGRIEMTPHSRYLHPCRCSCVIGGQPKPATPAGTARRGGRPALQGGRRPQARV